MTSNGTDTYSSPSGMLRDSLIRLTGKNITIYTAAGGKKSRSFSGILISVHEDYIKLVSEKKVKHVIVPRNPVRRTLFRLKYGCSQKILSIETIRTNITVKTDKITAINSMDYTMALSRPDIEKSPGKKRKTLPVILKKFILLILSGLKTGIPGKIPFSKAGYFSNVKLLNFHYKD